MKTFTFIVYIRKTIVSIYGEIVLIKQKMYTQLEHNNIIKYNFTEKIQNNIEVILFADDIGFRLYRETHTISIIECT